VEASAQRETQESGPAKFTIRERLLFDEGNFRLFLSQHNLESLKLHGIRLRREESCRALVTADLQNLELPFCEVADGWAALVESVSEGRGPIELRLGRHLFDSPERCMSFINTLRGNTYLERLDLSGICYGEGSPQVLASALLENKGLVCSLLSRWMRIGLSLLERAYGYIPSTQLSERSIFDTSTTLIGSLRVRPRSVIEPRRLRICC
jgi:hypothetical protein